MPSDAVVVTDPGVREAFAQDASGLRLVPDAVARPTSPEEAAAVLREASATGTPVTPAGALTGYVGGAIADRGIVLSLRGMDRILDIDPAGRTMRVQPGALLGDVKRAAAEHGLLFPPDPTSEEDSTLGGAIACNSSGARSLKYGATRPYVRGLTVALADGRVLAMRRTQLEKNVAGYALAHDPIDWFVGSEGTLGVVLEAELALLDLPTAVIGLGLPFPSAAEALAFVVAARESTEVAPRCIEYLDARAFAIARDHVGGTWGAGASAYVYVEEESFASPRSGQADSGEIDLDAWLALAEAHGALADDIQVFDGEPALREARRMRHAVPSTLNERAARFRAAGGRKVSTDWAVPYARLHEALVAADRIAAEHGVEPVATFGHAGNGHPHQHFVAHDARELEVIDRAVAATLRHVLSMGGTVAAEHGIGKLKRQWLPFQLSPVQLGVMRAIKHELDPAGILAPGNVL